MEDNIEIDGNFLGIYMNSTMLIQYELEPNSFLIQNSLIIVERSSSSKRKKSTTPRVAVAMCCFKFLVPSANQC